MEIINEYTQNQFNEKYYKDGTIRSKYYDTKRLYYENNRANILNRNQAYEQTYRDRRNELSRVMVRTIHYIKKGLLEREHMKFSKTVVAYMIIHKLKIKQIEYAKLCIELLSINL